MICIYMITNKINNKKYIGQTLNFKKRKKDHICNAKDNKINTHLYLAMRKYGIENFKFDILEEVKKEELNDKEIYYIKKYDTFNTGYNMTNGGENVTLNNHEVRKKISNTVKKQWEDGLYNYRKTNIKKAITVAHKNASKRAKKMWENEELKKQISKKISKKLSKPIIAYNKNEELMFESYQKAIDYFAKKNIRLHKAQITRAKKQNKILFNYYWKGLETISRESRNE